jgi:hypothetical protein
MAHVSPGVVWVNVVVTRQVGIVRYKYVATLAQTLAEGGGSGNKPV